MGCHLVSLSTPNWSSIQGLEAMKHSLTVWRVTWPSPAAFHLYWSTTRRKLWCQRCKATSLSETTHSSFVFLQGSLCIMFSMLFSVALQMWNFKCRVFKNNKEKNFNLGFDHNVCFSECFQIHVFFFFLTWIMGMILRFCFFLLNWQDNWLAHVLSFFLDNIWLRES